MRSDQTEHWRYLFSIAYRMLGTVADAEDAVQEAYARWSGVTQSEIDDPRAYLAQTVTRIAIDRLRSASRRRETYVGPWLPEPLLVEGDPADTADPDSLSTAFLVVLESLNPIERAIFLLREIFGYEHREIARIVERSEANVRQIARRARSAVEARRPRFPVPPSERRRVVAGFVEALQHADMDRMLALLADDAALTSDGGGRVTAARRRIEGGENVARFLSGVSRLAPTGSSVHETSVNGGPGVLIRVDGDPIAVFSFDVAGDRIAQIFVVLNPEKLAAIPKEMT